MSMFGWPVFIALLVSAAAYFFGGSGMFLTVAVLAILETTLSFDNAVINAKILQRMDAKWQRRFLFWGVPVAVFGTRFLLPLLIVSAASFISPLEVARLALFAPAAYFGYLSSARIGIASFGGTFLLMVSLKYFLDANKRVHWVKGIERRLSRWGDITAIELTIALATVLALAALSRGEAPAILFAGGIGIVLFMLIETLAGMFKMEAGHAAAGLALFFYLNTLDAAFSLDGVVAAFAVTNNLPAIIGGLGIGALFVRAFTVRLVRRKTLDTLIYMEHGAHWAIFGLSLTMLASIFVPVPEIFPGFVGLFFIALSYLSSRRAFPPR